ncbi:hypothetical protein [Streptomyces scabiei]|uniref:hypothetical protein n=1 Tax=Streptomyces scabiei TaxID=1930 RepID=UPI001FF33B60|nr:hypothetical protein [Streptomyces sp. LBUM 1481]
MTSSLTPAAPAAEAEASNPVRGARFALIALALLWPTQLLTLVGMLTGNAQASVAIHFQPPTWPVHPVHGACLHPADTVRDQAADLYGKRQ